jgi:menaquinone-dependent protoporphyrinogen oxidase
MKALVVYGTRYGTATEIAQEIGRVIESEGVKTDIMDARGIKDFNVSPYDLVVIGSGIKMGKWTKDSLKFLKKNKSELAKRKVAIFVTCGAANEEKNREEGRKKYLDQVAEKTLVNPPVAKGLFGSLYDPEAKHGFLYNMTMKAIKKDMEKQGLDTSKRIDYRDWNEIRTWAKELVK